MKSVYIPLKKPTYNYIRMFSNNSSTSKAKQIYGDEDAVYTE